MKEQDYNTELEKIHDFEIEITSIADCRRLMAELNEQEDILKKIKKNVKIDIRNVKSTYLNDRANIRQKYDSNKTPSLMESLKGPFGPNRYKEMKKLDTKRSETLDYLNEVQVIAENLLDQTEDIKKNVQEIIREMLGNF